MVRSLEKPEVAGMLCGEGTIVNDGQHGPRAVTLKCRAWTCEGCAPDRKKALTALAASGAPSTFITLTSNPATYSGPDARARALVIAWREVVRRIKRTYGYRDLAYFCVFEATKAGEPHLHILARVGYVPQYWLADQMVALMNAPIVDIRRVKSASQAAAYVAKYVGKAPHRFATCKRYWYTKGWDQSGWEKPPHDDEWDIRWQIRDMTMDQLEAFWQGWGMVTHRKDGMLYGQRTPP